MSELNKQFWGERYRTQKTGWDLGEISKPLKAYFDQLEDKSIKILIPGCGHAYEAEYLHQNGFTNVHIIDLVKEPLDSFKLRVPNFPTDHIHQGDFFEYEGQFDLIVEQTLFCAIDPKYRQDYAIAASNLLTPGGKLVGVMFGCEFEGGPPFGGSKEEYLTYFEPYFKAIKMEECHNSIDPRMGNELFVMLTK